MKQKKYTDIIRYGHRTTIDVLKPGDHIVIQEKIDGANASFRKDYDTIFAFSRNTQLDESNNLGGFWQWTQKLDINQLLDYFIYFGEWLNPHKVKYPQYEKQFFLFDIYDTRKKKYLSFEEVKVEAYILGLNLVPVFYHGEYQSYEHLTSFIGKTMIGGQFQDKEMGEGIVVKNVDYISNYGNQLFVKLVTNEFAEVQHQKKPKNPIAEATQEKLFVDKFVTLPRVEKFIYKFIDEGIIDENWGIEDMKVILHNLFKRIHEDLLKEESDELPLDYDNKQLTKSIANVCPRLVKEIINNSK